ncbi:hypothetical protein [Streptomyces sp. NBRC 109706]|uniref:hypothetical protein n=1 Tax=Streptomyces sp. NBRC 109706 TaxID=1550035 RepID=UPI0007849E49|nr:hypothetical protein [Streptomyces sp. NBRC 109706]
MSGQRTADWPAGVIARYATVGGGFVDVAERSGQYSKPEPTETAASCSGCSTVHVVDWGWSAYHDEFGTGLQPDFDEGGRCSTPEAREWAQSHAESCRALPRPGGA